MLPRAAPKDSSDGQFDGWPDPRNPAVVHRERVRTEQIWFHKCRLDWQKRQHATMRGVWFVCRYGNQQFEYVVNQSKRWLYQSAQCLTEWIEVEAPKSNPGGAAGPSRGAW